MHVMITGLAACCALPAAGLGSMAYFLALDAGGTKTQCCVADELRVVGRSRGGTVKIMADIAGGGDNGLSDQVLPGLATNNNYPSKNSTKF